MLKREKEPAITVIMPVYKVEKYLRRCIESVLSQTFHDWELILVDDGSPDTCGAICDEYANKDSRIIVIHQKNQGLSAARNTGIRAAKGSYLYFIDSDDFIPSDALEFEYNLAIAENVDFVIAGHSRVEPDGSIHADTTRWPERATTEEVQLALLRDKLPNFAWGRLSRRSLWENLRFPVGVLIEDMHVTPRLAYKAEKIAYTKRSLYYYSNENTDSIMHSGGASYIRRKYGQFLGWIVHEKTAREYAPEYVNECVAKATHLAVRTYTLNEDMNILTSEERKNIYDYLKSHNHLALSSSLKMGRWMILNNLHYILSLSGKMQRKLLDYQHERRISKMKKQFMKGNSHREIING